LSDRKKERKLQESWENLRNTPWKVYRERQAMLQRIDITIKFIDSKKEPLIQIADFISGVIYGVYKGDQTFFKENLERFFPEGNRTYRLLHIR
jgi:hypothetical protein